MSSNSNHESPGRKKYLTGARDLRTVVKRETRGRTRNLQEDLTERDMPRLESAARRAGVAGSTAPVAVEDRVQTERPLTARAATYVWTVADQWNIVDCIRQGMSARDIRRELFPNMTPGSVTLEVQMIRQHMRDTGADMGLGA